MQITPLEANFLLFALDDFCNTDARGKITCLPPHSGLDTEQVQDLRDRLMAIHEHPNE